MKSDTNFLKGKDNEENLTLHYPWKLKMQQKAEIIYKETQGKKKVASSGGIYLD